MIKIIAIKKFILINFFIAIFIVLISTSKINTSNPFLEVCRIVTVIFKILSYNMLKEDYLCVEYCMLF